MEKELIMKINWGYCKSTAIIKMKLNLMATLKHALNTLTIDKIDFKYENWKHVFEAELFDTIRESYTFTFDELHLISETERFRFINQEAKFKAFEQFMVDVKRLVRNNIKPTTKN